MTKQADLIAFIFGGGQHDFAGVVMQWMETSPRYTTFIETYRDKIRKKVRNMRDQESILDLRSELEVAYRLLNDRRLAVTYEPYASAKRRGPDFAVAYRVNLVFNLEVARNRGEEKKLAEIDLHRQEEHILRILLDKLGQMQPGMPNLLVIQASADLAHSIELSRLIQQVKVKVEGKAPSFYALSRYSGPADFYKDFLRLSGMVLWSRASQVWLNKQARPGLDEKVLHLVSSLLSGGTVLGREYENLSGRRHV